MAKHLWHIFFVFFCLHIAQAQQTDSTKQLKADTITIQNHTAETPTTAPVPTPTTVPAPSTNTLTPHTTPSGKVQIVDPKPFSRLLKRPTLKKLNKDLILMYKDTSVFNRKKEIVIKNKRYRIYNNYITIGGGYGYNSGWPGGQLNSAVDYQFHVKKMQFQLGAFLMGPYFLILSTAANAHVGFGYKIERCTYFFAAYGGISYTGGYKRSDTSALYNQAISNVGGYINAKIFYKINFDYGLGTCFFVDVNAAQTIVGVRLELFFSGAYRGFKKINWAKEDEKYAR
ncbi:MAG: hypothetical protein JST67_04690 [Bacteroidetes bacterium]|nr:hypothetical protein [Bacteroidota bacterium]